MPDAVESSPAARFLLALAVVLICLWVWGRTTWYLAIDQFGYLTFARDLAAGRVFHDWPLLPAIGWLIPRGFDADVLSQTYVLSSRGAYCRYSPGFPIVLASVGRLLGEAAEHAVNVAALGFLLVVSFALARRILRSEWLAAAHALLVVLLPNYVLLWSISPLRDVPAHAVALGGLAALLAAGQGRSTPLWPFAGGCLLGYAVAVRVDAILYLLPAAAVGAIVVHLRGARLAAALAGAAIGVGPLLAYNAIATGNPLRPTQAMELRELVSLDLPGAARRLASALSREPEARAAGREPAAPEGEAARASGVGHGAPGSQGATTGSSPARGVDAARRLVQGGGFRLRHLGETLPGNVAWTRSVLGGLGSVLLVVGAIGALARPELLWIGVLYPAVAVLFFSMWVRPDPRYIAGAVLLAPLVVLHGAGCVVEWPAAVRARWGAAPAAGGAVVLGAIAIGLAGRQDFAVANALPWVTVGLAAAVVAGLAAALRGGPGAGAVAFRIVAASLLAAVLVWRFALGAGSRATFQRPELERAKATVAATFAPRSVVFTSDSIGRPAENLGYYTQVSAVYFSEVARWGRPWHEFVRSLIRADWIVYVLLPPHEARARVAEISPWFETEVVAQIPAAEAIRFFVASPRHRGVPLALVRIGREKPLPGDR